MTGWLLAAFFLLCTATETIRVSAAMMLLQLFRLWHLPVSGIHGWDGISKNGTAGAARMNYNILNDQIMYIDKKGDTFARPSCNV